MSRKRQQTSRTDNQALARTRNPQEFEPSFGVQLHIEFQMMTRTSQNVQSENLILPWFVPADMETAHYLEQMLSGDRNLDDETKIELALAVLLERLAALQQDRLN